MLVVGSRQLLLFATVILVITADAWPQNRGNQENYATNLSGHNTTHNMDSSGGSKIVFPEESGVFPEESASKYTPQVDGQKPKCVNEYDFCESVNGYPRDYLKKVLENDVGASIYQQFFGSDLLDVGPRFGEEETSLCPSVEEIVFPKVAQNKDAKWRYVINEEDYVQGIRIEKCGKQSSCTFSENFPAGYTTSCQQKYIYRKLLAYADDGKPTADSFRLPSCCSCVVTKSLQSGRMAGDPGKSQTPARHKTRRRRRK